MARAFGSYPKGRGFDSLRRYHMNFVQNLFELNINRGTNHID